MRIGIIGTGSIGGTLARLFTRAGHEVLVANSRGPDTLAELVNELGPSARAATVEDAARGADVVVVAIPFFRYVELPADAFTGKVVIDAMNYYPARDGQIAAVDDGTTTSSALLATQVPSARVVKGFNTLYFERLAEDGNTSLSADDRIAILIATDDPEARAVVAELIDEIGYTAVDAGSLAESGRQEPGSAFYGQELTATEARRRLAQEA